MNTENKQNQVSTTRDKKETQIKNKFNNNRKISSFCKRWKPVIHVRHVKIIFALNMHIAIANIVKPIIFTVNKINTCFFCCNFDILIYH